MSGILIIQDNSLAEQWPTRIFRLAEQCYTHSILAGLKHEINPKNEYKLKNYPDFDLKNEDNLKN